MVLKNDKIYGNLFDIIVYNLFRYDFKLYFGDDFQTFYGAWHNILSIKQIEQC